MEIDIRYSLELLAKSSPFLKQKITEEREEWEPDAPPITVLMGMLGKVVVINYEKFSENECKKIFNCIENLLLNGDQMVRDSVSTGFLEGIIHRLDKNKDASSLVAFFGEEAKKYCIAWDNFAKVRTIELY